MSELKNNLETLAEDLKDYVATNIQLTKLRIYEKSATFFADVFTQSVLSIIMILAVLFLSTALAFYLSSVLESTALGFVIMGALYVVAFLAIYMSQKAVLTRPFKNMIIKELLTETNQDE